MYTPLAQEGEHVGTLLRSVLLFQRVSRSLVRKKREKMRKRGRVAGWWVGRLCEATPPLQQPGPMETRMWCAGEAFAALSLTHVCRSGALIG